MKIWKLLSALVLHGGLFIAVPYFLSRSGLIPALSWRAYVVLVVTWIGLGLKLLFGDVISDRFDYHKHGYDFCVLTMGTALSMLSLQTVSSADILPSLPMRGPWIVFSLVSGDVVKQRIALFAAWFIITCFLSLLTARISRAVLDPATQGKNLLSLLNIGIGASAFGAYLFLLLAKA